MTRVLVIDDEPQILRALRINLSVRGYEVITAPTGSRALALAAEHPPQVVDVPEMFTLRVRVVELTNVTELTVGGVV